MNNYSEFVKTFSSPNTAKVINSLSDIGNYEYSDCTAEEIEQVILNLKPNSPKAIRTICYVMSLYGKYLNNVNLIRQVRDLNQIEIWEKAKLLAKSKFLSHMEFEAAYHEIGMYEECNALYYQTIFWCIYEGIFNNDMSVLKNLKASDISGNTIILREDNGHSYEFVAPEKLIQDLRELATIDIWERKNRYGIFKINVQGVSSDCCFKIENRGADNDSQYAYRYSYYRQLRKITNEYLGRSIVPTQIFVSGIMYRIRMMLQHEGITLEEAFALDNRDKMVKKIVVDELARCNYDILYSNFKEIVKGHLDIFSV